MIKYLGIKRHNDWNLFLNCSEKIHFLKRKINKFDKILASNQSGQRIYRASFFFFF